MKTLASSKVILTLLTSTYHLMSSTRPTNQVLIFLGRKASKNKKKSTIIGEKVNGGRKMIDFGIIEIALQISRIQKIQQNSDAGWKAIPERLLGDLGGLTFLSHCLYSINLIQSRNLPAFYRSVLKYWPDYRSDFSDDNTQIQNRIMWNNSTILINKNTIFFKQWYQNGVICLMLMAPFFPSKNSSKNCGCIFPLPHIMG